MRTPDRDDYYEEPREAVSSQNEPPHRRPRRQPRGRLDINELPVWTWVAILLVVVIFGGALWLMTRGGEEESTPLPAAVEPTDEAPSPAIDGTIPADGTPTPIIAAVTPTPPLPAQVAAGVRVAVTGTGESKLRVRAGPGTDFATLIIVPDGTEFIVLEGPQSEGGYTWWRVEGADGTKGWVAEQFITPIR